MEFHGLGSLPEEFVEVASFEQSVAVNWVSMHWEFPTGSPITNRVVVDAEVLGSLCGVQVFRQFGHRFWSRWAGGDVHQDTSLTKPPRFEHHTAILHPS